MAEDKKPLLLVDNRNVMSLMNDGQFICHILTFEEARDIIGTFDEEDILRCYDGSDLDEIIHSYLGIEKRDFKYKRIRNMRPGQDAIAFKLYVTPSETQPIVTTPEGAQAKKIQNIYIYCQLISRIK